MDNAILGRGFAFIPNVVALDGFAEAELCPEHVIRLSTRQEAIEIKERLSGLGGGGTVAFHWEQGAFEHGNGLDKWQYHVIAFPGGNSTLAELEPILALCHRAPRIGLTILHYSAGSSVVWMGDRLHQYLFDMGTRGGDSLRENDVEMIRQTYNQYKNHDHNIVNIRRVAQELLSLDGIADSSPIKFLGYFAVLESMVTHAPRETDPYSSITRQVTTKAALCNRRVPRPFNYDAFTERSPDKIWKLLYSYRSALAHGTVPDFKSKLRGIKGPMEALNFLRMTTREIALLALVEPQLIADLREC